MTDQIAVIGAGLVGARHAELVAKDGCLAAIVDPSDAAQELAARLGVPWFDTTKACLNATTLNGAIVATPNRLHRPVSEALIAHGIPALIEKPIADTVEAAEAVTKLATDKGVPLLVGHHRRHNPIIAEAKRIIDAGTLGRMTLVDATFWLFKPDDYFDQTWRQNPGAGPVFINLIHDIDLIRHLCGEITSVQASQSTAARGFEVEDTAVVLLHFANGALGTLSISDTTVAPWSWEFTAAENPAYPHVPGAAYKIGGTAASLSVPDLTLWQHDGAKSWWEPITGAVHPVTSGDALRLQLAHFREVMHRRADPLVSAQSATQSLAVIEAIKHAAQIGSRVDLPG